MAFEDPSPTVRWECTPQHLLRSALNEGFYFSVGDVKNKLPNIIKLMKGVHDPELAATLKFLEGFQVHAERLCKAMPGLIKYCHEQANALDPRPRNTRSLPTTPKECEQCGDTFDAMPRAKYCTPGCRSLAEAKRSLDRETKEKGKAKRSK